MARSFSASAVAGSLRGAAWKDPRVFMRVILGALLVANLIAAAFAFHLFGQAPDDLRREVESTTRNVAEQRNRLIRTRQIVAKVQLARGQGDQFLASYMTPRRTTYSTIVSELQQAAETAGMTWKEGTLALEPIKGSDTLSMMTITVGFEGPYPNLLKFVNELDRSPRFLIIEGLQATPQPGGKTLSITSKVNAFVRDDFEDAL